jgi:RNA recognition motif-containing protein
MIQESDIAVAGGYRRPRDTDPSKAAAFQRLKRRVEERRADRTRLVLLELMSQRFEKGALLKNRPPQNVLFVCKLSQDTTSERLSRAFHTAGFTVVSCEVLIDKNTRRSLQYGFVEFPDAKTCEDAYRKMEGHRVDDKRIHVDFSQSVLGASRAS